MKTESEFPEIGKRMTYSVPEGFFDRITDATLTKALKRKQSHSKIVVLRRTLLAAASLTAFIMAGYWIFNQPDRPDKSAGYTKNVSPADNRLQEKTLSEVGAVTGKTEFKWQKEPEHTAGDITGEYTLDELLASLPDETLLQMEGLSVSDIFLDVNEKKQEK